MLFMHAPTAVVPSRRSPQACIPLMRDGAKPVLTCWLGAAVVQQADAGLRRRPACRPTATPERAVDRLRAPRAVPAQPGGAAADAAVEPAAVRARRDAARGGDRRARWPRGATCSNEVRGQGAARRPTASRWSPTRGRALIDEAAAMAGDIGYPVVLKILSPQMSHKSDVGGVALSAGRRSRGAARRAGDGQRACSTLRPDARIDGLHGAGDGAPAARARADRRRRPATRRSARC